MASGQIWVCILISILSLVFQLYVVNNTEKRGKIFMGLQCMRSSDHLNSAVRTKAHHSQCHGTAYSLKALLEYYITAGLQAQLFRHNQPLLLRQPPLPHTHICCYAIPYPQLKLNQGIQGFIAHSPYQHSITQGSGNMSHSLHQPLHSRSQKQLYSQRLEWGEVGQ